MKPITLCTLIALLFTCSQTATARDFYIDPENGSPQGDGSEDRPWKTLQGVLERGLIQTRDWAEHPYQQDAALSPVHPDAPVGPGDTLRLRSGYHGRIEIIGAYNEEPITITATQGERPTIGHILLRGAANWVIEGLSVSGSHAPEYDKRTLVHIDDHDWRGPCRNITIRDCDIFSVPDASGWGPEDWVERAAHGIVAEGEHIRLENNRVRNIRHGITVGGPRGRVSRNVVDGFSGDGLRGLGDFGVFEYNIVKNAYDVDNNHDDGFQSWSTGPDGVGSGAVEGIVLRGNLILNHEDPDHPYRATLQGIGCFDGMFVGWVIENNVVITDHWHGITLLGARDCRIVNNTVIDLDESEPGPPWVRVGRHKDGRASEGILIRNNLAGSIRTEGQEGVRADHNIAVEDPSEFFVDVAAFDLHLRKDAPAVDAGTEEHAPEIDRDGTPRPQGEAVDIGAYEWQPADAENGR